MNIWEELGIPPSREQRQIKLAYAARLKQVHPEDDAEGFQRLRAAYELALRQAQVPAPRLAPPPPKVESPQAESADQPSAGSTVATPPLPPVPEPEPEQVAQAPAPQAAPVPERAAPPVLTPPPIAPIPARPPPATPPPAVVIRPAASPVASGRRYAQEGPLEISHPPPAVAARQLFDRLLAAPAHQRAAVLKAALLARGWEHLDFQAAVERALISGLASNFEVLCEIAKTFSAHYGWEARTRRVNDHDPQLAALITRLEARRQRAALEYPLRNPDPRRQQAFRLLLGGVDEQAFKRFARYAKNLGAMRAILARVQTTEIAVLRYELNTKSVDWWSRHLGSQPLTLDQVARLLGYGFLGAILLCAAPLSDLVDKLQQGKAGAAKITATLLLFSTCLLLPLGINAALRFARRRKLGERLKASQGKWHSDRRLRHTVLAATVLSLSLSVGTTADGMAWTAIFAVLSVLLLFFWTSARSASVALIATAWPLQAPLSALISALSDRWPWINHHYYSPPTILFPHLVAAYGVEPFTRFCTRARKKFRGNVPKDPVRTAFYAAIALAVMTAFLYGGLTDRDGPSPGANPSKSAKVYAPLTSAPRTRLQRLLPEADEVMKQAQPDFSRLFTEYRRRHPEAKTGQIVLAYTVLPNGEVRECHLLSSTYQDSDFENQMIEQIKRLRFKSEPGTAWTSYTVSFGKPLKPAAADPDAKS